MQLSLNALAVCHYVTGRRCCALLNVFCKPPPLLLKVSSRRNTHFHKNSFSNSRLKTDQNHRFCPLPHPPPPDSPDPAAAVASTASLLGPDLAASCLCSRGRRQLSRSRELASFFCNGCNRQTQARVRRRWVGLAISLRSALVFSRPAATAAAAVLTASGTRAASVRAAYAFRSAATAVSFSSSRSALFECSAVGAINKMLAGDGAPP